MLIIRRSGAANNGLEPESLREVVLARPRPLSVGRGGPVDITGRGLM